MNRQDIVEKIIEKLASLKKPVLNGDPELLHFLYWWFSEQVKDNHEYFGIVDFLPMYLAEAMEYFRTIEEDGYTKSYRDKYLRPRGYSRFPVLTSVTEDEFQGRDIVINKLAHWFSEMADDPKVYTAIVSYFTAEDLVLMQAMQTFNRQVWRKGMWKTIHDSEKTHFSSKCGSVDLSVTRYYETKLMLTFSSPVLEHQVTFLVNLDDSFGATTRLKSIKTSLDVALEMINEFSRLWPSSKNGLV